MHDNDTLKGKLEAAVKAVKAKDSYFAFSPDARAPALMIQRRPLPPGKFRRMFASEDVDINKGQIWVGTVKKDGGKLRFALDAKGSAGSPKANKMAAGFKKLAKSCNIPKLRSAVIVSPQADVEAAEARETVNPGDPGMQRKGRYRDAFKTLDQLRQSDMDNKKRARLNKQMQRDAAGWLFDHALGKKRDRGGFSDEAKQDVWKLQKMAFAANGQPPRRKEMKLAAHFMEGDVQAAIVHANTAGDPAASADKLEDVIADLELYLDNPPKGCEAEIAKLRGLLEQAMRKLEAVQALIPDDAPDVEDEQPEVGGPWTKEDRNGRLVVPEDTEIIVPPEPGVKAKLGKSCEIFRDKALTDKIGDGEKGARCIMAKTDVAGVVKIELYENKEDQVDAEFLMQGYTGDRAVSHHFQKRSHQKKHDKRLFDAPPDMDDIEQGSLGDCYMLAALAAIAKNEPETISRMIRDNNDGTVTVKMFDVQVDEDGAKTFVPKYIQVEKSLHHKAMSGETERAEGSMWVAMIEKAFAAQGYAFQHKKRPDEIVSLSYVGTEGGHANETFEVLLGRESTNSEVEITPETPWTSESMDARLRQGRLPGSELREQLGVSKEDVLILAQIGYRGIELPTQFDDVTRTDDMELVLKAAGLEGELEIDYAMIRQRISGRRRGLEGQKRILLSGRDNNRLLLDEERAKLVDDPENEAVKAEIARLELAIAEVPAQLASYEEDIAAIDEYLDEMPEDGTKTISLDDYRSTLSNKMMENGKLAGPMGSGKYTGVQKAMLAEIDDGLAAGACLAASTRAKLPGKKDGSGKSAGEPMSGGLVGSHVYTITGAEPAPDEREDDAVIFILVRNPWGSTGRVYEEVDGELKQRPTSLAISKMELGEFFRNFKGVQRC